MQAQRTPKVPSAGVAKASPMKVSREFFIMLKKETDSVRV